MEKNNCGRSSHAIESEFIVWCNRQTCELNGGLPRYTAK